MNWRSPHLRWIAGIGLCTVVIDQIIKAIVRARIDTPPARGVDVFFQFTHHENTGVVGGAFREIPLFGYVAPLVAFAVLLYLIRHVHPESRFQWTAFGLILGGAIGNYIDRLVFGAVTDFLQFHFYFVPFDFPWKYYPAFNLADSAIVVGVGLLILGWNAGTEGHVSDAA